jgi:hypothetical protein
MHSYAKLGDQERTHSYAKLNKAMQSYAKIYNTEQSYAKISKAMRSYVKQDAMQSYAQLGEQARKAGGTGLWRRGNPGGRGTLIGENMWAVQDLEILNILKS